jgi:hypothetical protein
VLERLFAATPRGAALINRIKNDPQLGHAEVRVMSHSGDYLRVVSKPSGAPPPPPAEPAPAAAGDGAIATEAPPAPPVAAEPPVRPLDWHGTRRAPRHRIRDGVEIQLDGNPAQIVDLSQVGAQVISQTILRPNQRVRVSMPNDDFVMRFRGSIAWAKFELPQPSEPPAIAPASSSRMPTPPPSSPTARRTRSSDVRSTDFGPASLPRNRPKADSNVHVGERACARQSL